MRRRMVFFFCHLSYVITKNLKLAGLLAMEQRSFVTIFKNIQGQLDEVKPF